MAEQTLKERTAKGLFWGGVSNGVQQILNALFGLILLRILDVSDYGMVTMLAIFSAIASTIQESGFTAALTNKKEIRHEDYNAVFWFSSLSGVCFYILLFFCAPLIADFYDEPELIPLSRVVFLSFLFGGPGIASNAYLFKTLMAKERAKIDIIALVCSGIVGVTLALNGFAYYGLAIQTVTYIGVGSLLRLLYAPWKPTFQIDLYPLKMMFGFSSKLILTNIFTQISNNLFSVVLGKFYNPQQVGFYSQGQKWMSMGNQLIGGMINSVAQPILVQVSDDIERQRKVFRKMVRFGAFISFPSMLGLAFIAKEFVWIFLGEKWLPSVPFLQLFCLWGAAHYLWLLYSNLLISHGKSDIYLYGMVLTGFLQLIVVGLLFPFGIYSMMIGYVVMYYMGLLYWHYFTNKILSIALFDIMKDVTPYIGAIFVSFLTAHIITLYVENIYITFLLKIMVTVIAYCTIMWFGNSSVFKDALGYLRR